MSEAVALQPKVVIGVFGGSKIGVTGSIFDQLLDEKTVRLAMVDSVDEAPHEIEPRLRFTKRGWALWWARTCATDWGGAQQRQRVVGFMWRGTGCLVGKFDEPTVPPGRVRDCLDPPEQAPEDHWLQDGTALKAVRVKHQVGHPRKLGIALVKGVEKYVFGVTGPATTILAKEERTEGTEAALYFDD